MSPSTHTEPPPRFDEGGDASRRTRLANERTYLAWWRTGLTAMAVALGAGKLLPALAGGARWLYTVAGAGFAAIGIFFIGYAFMRHKQVEEAIERGEYARPDDRVVAVLAVAGVVLGLLVLALVIAEH